MDANDRRAFSYEWQKGFWSRPVELYRDEKKLGELTYDHGFTSRATGRIGETTYRFRIQGVVSPKVSITSEDGEHHEITLGTWRSTGKLLGRWKWSTNVWNTRWEWRDLEDDSLVCSGQASALGTRGSVSVNQLDVEPGPELFVLSGLYVNAYLLEMTALLLVILVVIW